MWLRGINGEIEKRGKDRITVSLGRLSVVLGQRDQKRKDFFSFKASEVPVTESRVEMRQDKLTGLDGIFFSNWFGDNAGDIRLPVKRS